MTMTTLLPLWLVGLSAAPAAAPGAALEGATSAGPEMDEPVEQAGEREDALLGGGQAHEGVALVDAAEVQPGPARRLSRVSPARICRSILRS
jgi:hypothetical protein